MTGTGLAAAPTLALVALAAIVWPDEAADVVVWSSALLLLLVAAYMLIELTGLPFLGLGALAVLGACLAAWLVEPAGTWPALVLSGVAGGLLLALVAPLLTGSGKPLVAGSTLGLSVVAALIPWPATSVPAMSAETTSAAAVAMALAGIVSADRLSRSAVGLAAMALRRSPEGSESAGPGSEAIQLLPIAVAGLAATAAGAMLALFHPLAWQELPPSALALSTGTLAAACLAGGDGPGRVLLAGLPLLVVPSLALEIWPQAPDLRLSIPAVALLGILTLRAWRRRDA